TGSKDCSRDRTESGYFEHPLSRCTGAPSQPAGRPGTNLAVARRRGTGCAQTVVDVSRGFLSGGRRDGGGRRAHEASYLRRKIVATGHDDRTVLYARTPPPICHG